MQRRASDGSPLSCSATGQVVDLPLSDHQLALSLEDFSTEDEAREATPTLF